MSELIRAINMIVNKSDPNIQYYQGEVVEQLDGSKYNSEEYTIRVKLITSMASNQVVNEDVAYINSNSLLKSNILDNVKLMSSVDDGILYIPTIGSIVTVMIGKTQIPYVAQYSSIDMVQIDLLEDYDIDVGLNGQTSELHLSGLTASITVNSSDDSSFLMLKSNQIDMNVLNKSTLLMNETSIQLDIDASSNINLADTIDINSKNGASLIMDTGISATTSGNAEISAETLITLKNNVASLNELFNDLITALNTGANSGGPVVFSGDPGFVALLVKVNGLLGT